MKSLKKTGWKAALLLAAIALVPACGERRGDYPQDRNYRDQSPQSPSKTPGSGPTP